MNSSTLEFSGPIEVVRQTVLANPGLSEPALFQLLLIDPEIHLNTWRLPNMAEKFLTRSLRALKSTKSLRNEYRERNGQRERVWFPPREAASSPKRHAPISGEPTITSPPTAKPRDGAQVKRRAVKPRKPKQSPVSATAPARGPYRRKYDGIIYRRKI
jgi:hypothetical protein